MNKQGIGIQDVGFKEPGRITRLLCNPLSHHVIACIEVARPHDFITNRIYFRGPQEGAYTPVPPLDDEESQDDVFSCASASEVIFHSVAWKTFDDGGRIARAGNSMGVWKLDLTTGKRSMVLSPTAPKPMAPYVGATVSRILDVQPDGAGAVLLLGLSRPSGSLGTKVDYTIRKVDFRTHSSVHVADLVLDGLA